MERYLEEVDDRTRFFVEGNHTSAQGQHLHRYTKDWHSSWRRLERSQDRKEA